MTSDAVAIVSALLHPEHLLDRSATDWDLIIRQGRRANLLGKLAYRIEDAGITDQLFPPAKPHLVSSRSVAEQQGRAIRWEVRCIVEALSSLQIPVILLKGAAYVMSAAPVADGRVFSDVDILVPKGEIAKVEAALMMYGWHGGHHDPYYQRYYRRWMHEIPPMMHIRRGTVIDVHHTILPETARIKVNTAALWDSLVQVPNAENIYVLPPMDMILHSATHLFHEGELHNGLRDLFDLDGLFRDFGTAPGFWEEIVPRARHLGLERPLYYALRYTSRVLNTPIPQDVLRNARGPNAVVRFMMDFCYLRTLRPDHSTCLVRWTSIAKLALYVRSHWIRMPMFLLLYHLAHKALVSNDQDHEKTEKGKAPPQK